MAEIVTVVVEVLMVVAMAVVIVVTAVGIMVVVKFVDDGAGGNGGSGDGGDGTVPWFWRSHCGPNGGKGRGNCDRRCSIVSYNIPINISVV